MLESQREKIDSLLKICTSTNETELKEYITQVNDSIYQYELLLYQENEYNDYHSQIIQKWRQTLIKNIKKIKNKLTEAIQNEKLSTNIQRNDTKDLEETVHLVHRQIKKADSNTSELMRSTIKLKKLNLSSKDLQKEIENAKKEILQRKLVESKEIRMIKFAFLFFILVCCLIVVDRLGLSYLLKFIINFFRN